MNSRNVLMIVLILNMSLLYGQGNVVKGTNVKNGHFYFYPKNSKDRFCIVRRDSSQKEINLNTNDTSFWSVSWQNDSSFYVKYLHSTKKISDGQLSFYKAHLVVIRIRNISSQYYTFSGALDSFDYLGNTYDTAWFKPKITAEKN